MSAPDGDLASDLKTWLGPRLEELPEDLAAAVRTCLGRAPPRPPPGERPEDASRGASPTLPGRLAEAAVRELEAVLELSGDRVAAVRLLAADACLTYAFQAAAELGSDIPRLADGVGLGGRLGAALAERARAGSEPAAPEREPAESPREHG